MKVFQRYRFAALLFTATMLVTAFADPLGGQEFEYRRIALTGNSVLGGGEFQRFTRLQINRLEQVVFSALLSGPTVDESNDFGIFFGSGLVREGQTIGALPPGVQFNELDPNFQVIPRFAFLTTLAGTGINVLNDNDKAILAIPNSSVSNNLSVLARTGDPVPGTEPGTVFSDLSNLGANASGPLFLADLTGPSVTPANFQVIHNGFSVIARTGDRAPSTPNNVVFQSLGAPTRPGAFSAQLSGPGVTSANDDALYAVTSGIIPEQLVREGDLVPGREIARFRSFGPVIASSGEGLAFRATFSGYDSPDEGIFCGLQVRTVAATGGVAPGTSNDARFVSFSNPALDTAGNTSFVAVLSFGGDIVKQGIYIESFNTNPQSRLRLALLSGTAVPGLDATIREVSGTSLARNTRGQVAFTGVLEGDSVTSENDHALFATNRRGEPRIIAREGEPFDVDSRPETQDLRIVRNINFFGDFPLQLNFGETLTFELTFDDGASGIFQAETFDLVGDFDSNNRIDIDDIDFYSGNLDQSASFDPRLDLNNDGSITLTDHDLFVNTLVETTSGTGALIGDMNLDGTVDILRDAFILVANLGSSGPFSYGLGDLNADQQVDVVEDAFRLVANLGMSR